MTKAQAACEQMTLSFAGVVDPNRLEFANAVGKRLRTSWYKAKAVPMRARQPSAGHGGV
jgi:hypothetical protein